MRVAVLADIHGNLPALEAVLADASQQGVDEYIVAGDFTGGPHPQETLDLLLSLGCWLIRGNSEDYVLAIDTGEAPRAWQVSDQWATLRWSFERLSRESIDHIAGLPEQRCLVLNGAAPLRVVHGSPSNPSAFLYPDGDLTALEFYRRAELLPQDGQLPELAAVLAGVGEQTLVCGHSHISWIQEADGRLAVNVGAVSSPNNDDLGAQYGLLEWREGHWWAKLRSVPYDLEEARAAFENTGLLEAGGAMAEAFLLGILTAQNVPGRFARHVRRLEEAAGCVPGEETPDAVWQQAIATFEWAEFTHGRSERS
jgi:predicted phosphodiesterase